MPQLCRNPYSVSTDRNGWDVSATAPNTPRILPHRIPATYKAGDVRSFSEEEDEAEMQRIHLFFDLARTLGRRNAPWRR